MNQRAQLTVQILEKIGAPLMAAVTDIYTRTSPAAGADDVAAQAQRLAELLAKTILTSTQLSARLNLQAAPESNEALSLALAALCADLIAAQYRQTGKVPDEMDIKRAVMALEAVISFGDNFTLGAEPILRLVALEPGVEPADEAQIELQYLNALVPVVNAVADYSFGQQEKKLAQDIAERLITQAAGLRRIFTNEPAESKGAKQAELKILRGLALVYVECHEAEKRRLLTLDDAARAQALQAGGGTLSVAPVWQAFDLRLSMMEHLGASLLSQQGTSQGPAVAPVAPPQAPIFTPPPAAVAVPPAEEPVAPPAQTGPYNPMAFFKPGAKPPPSDEAGEG